jgi:hypothetical protein
VECSNQHAQREDLNRRSGVGLCLDGDGDWILIDVPQLLRLHLHHAEATGRVIRVIPNSHGFTEIEYSIQGTPYKREFPGYWVPALRTDGGSIRVYYDPNEPSVASAVPADEVLMGQLPSWIGASVLGSVFGAAIALKITRYRDRWGRSS